MISDPARSEHGAAPVHELAETHKRGAQPRGPVGPPIPPEVNPLPAPHRPAMLWEEGSTVRTDQRAADRERLRSELRDARKQAGLTQKEVAAAMDWSASKMLRIEAGA